MNALLRVLKQFNTWGSMSAIGLVVFLESCLRAITKEIDNCLKQLRSLPFLPHLLLSVSLCHLLCEKVWM